MNSKVKHLTFGWAQQKYPQTITKHVLSNFYKKVKHNYQPTKQSVLEAK